MATLNLTPTVIDLNLYRGDDTFLSVTVTEADGSAADLAGATPKSQIRESFDAETAVAELAATITGNTVNLHLQHADAALLPAVAVWDLQLTWSDTTITTIAMGTVKVIGEVTR
jgi:hypothetical protein